MRHQRTLLVYLWGTFEDLIREKKQVRLVTTFTALSRENSQIAETPLMQMNRINAIDAYVLYKQTRSRFPSWTSPVRSRSPALRFKSLRQPEKVLLQNAPLSDLERRFQNINCFLPPLQRHLRVDVLIHIERVAQLIGYRLRIDIQSFHQ